MLVNYSPRKGIDDVSLVTLLEDITRTQQALRAGIAKMPPLTAPMNVAPLEKFVSDCRRLDAF
jgi:hypothetical protein